MREVEIECLPADIPSHIDVDVSHLELHRVLRVSGLPHSEKIKYLNSEDATVAHVVTIREEAPTPTEVEAAEAAAAAAAAAEGAAPAEPEVAKKGGKRRRKMRPRSPTRQRQERNPMRVPRQRNPRERSNPWPRKASSFTPASQNRSPGVPNPANARPLFGGGAGQSRPRVSVDPAQRGVHGHRPHRPARGRCGREPALPGRYRNLPHGGARGGSGQAGDVYEPERAGSGRAGSGV